MSSDFNNSSIFYNYNFVSIFNSRKPMCNNNNSSSFIEFFKILYNLSFILCIQRIGCFVKKYEIRIFIYRSCYKYALFLSLTNANSITANYCIIFQWKRHNIIVDTSYFSCIFQLINTNFPIINGNISCN